jgi:hypothetical protein
LFNKLDLQKSLADYDASYGYGFLNKYAIGDSIAVKENGFFLFPPGFTDPELQQFDNPEPSLGYKEGGISDLVRTHQGSLSGKMMRTAT